MSDHKQFYSPKHHASIVTVKLFTGDYGAYFCGRRLGGFGATREEAVADLVASGK